MEDANFGVHTLMCGIVPDTLRSELKIGHQAIETPAEEVRSTQMSVNSLTDLLAIWAIPPISIYIACQITAEFGLARMRRLFGR